MSVDRKDYIVYGWRFDSIKDSTGKKIDVWDDKYKPYIEGWENEEFTLIYDGMCGQYTVFGLLILDKNDDSCGWEFVKLEFNNLDSDKVKNKFKELFGYTPEQEPELFIFSHFS